MQNNINKLKNITISKIGEEVEAQQIKTERIIALTELLRVILPYTYKGKK